MKTYEVTYITKEDLNSPTGENPVEAAIKSLEGNILNVSALGQKQFAYPINKENRGFYTTIVFGMEAEKLNDLNRKLNLDEDVLRFLILGFEGNIENLTSNTTKTAVKKESKPVEEVAKNEVVEEKATEEEITKEETPDSGSEPTKETETAETAKEPEVKEETAEKVEEEKPEVIEEPKEEKLEKTETAKPEEEKAVKKVKPKKPAVEEPVDEEERLKALDKKLDELLKD